MTASPGAPLGPSFSAASPATTTVPAPALVAPASSSSPASSGPGLSRLRDVRLAALPQAMLEMAAAEAGGPPPCRLRMKAEARDLLALAQISGGRLQVQWIDLTVGLRAKVIMECPVPWMTDPSGELQIASAAVLGLIYTPEAMLLPQPGYAAVRILEPRSVWLGNASADHNQVLCLGASLPPGIPLKEIVLMTYGSLSMQTALTDRFDPAGVLNPAAAEWWQRNPTRIPLSREPFLRKERSHVS